MTANRADANGRTTEIPGQQRQAGKPFYHIHRLSKLRHAHAPHHRGRRRGRKGAHCLTYVPRGNAGQMLNLFWGVIFDGLTIGIEPLSKACDVGFVVQLLFQQDVAERINQRHIAAVFER
ncbi:hypothetical protein D3C87_1719940 [compost metagenome]